LFSACFEQREQWIATSATSSTDSIFLPSNRSPFAAARQLSMTIPDIARPTLPSATANCAGYLRLLRTALVVGAAAASNRQQIAIISATNQAPRLSESSVS
jgi:hypothetical protein